MNELNGSIVGNVFEIQRWSLHDGPGIRTMVFLKGCPLKCIWCCNPESQKTYTEIAYFKDKCIDCSRCITGCPHGAVSVNENGYSTNYNICRENCYGVVVPPYPCTSKCYANARKNIGTEMTTDKVLEEVLKDNIIYTQSGGGITVSGGEPMLQFSFVKELLKESKKNNLHTAMETCGFVKWENYEEVLEYLDFLFLDIKQFDNEKHIKITGQDNTLILDNSRKLANLARQKGIKMVVRIPVIPGLTDSNENINSIAKFVSSELDGVNVVELMPYHRLGRGKYTDIGMTYELGDLEPPSEDHINNLKKIILSYGLSISY
jgi:pyruvate formate lyase activating enzyme